jgi:tRNA-2-methylthio-N6-dimethylallyladenosine synthase
LDKKLFIKTYGCQMNVYDSARMADVMAPHGYSLAEGPDEADIIVLNTCHIREKAAEKVYSELGRIRRIKDERQAAGGDLLIAVAGCVAQAEGEEIQARAPYVDMIFGPQTYHHLPAMVARATRGEAVIAMDLPVEEKFDLLPEEAAPQGPAAFLTIQEGCDKFCAFCVVPYTRGAEYSRPIAQVLAEAHRLVETGAREITLLGQNVNAYRGATVDGDVWGLGRLVMALAEVDGLERIRYTTSHPRDVDDELIAAHRDVPKLMPYLHLPVQSGADGILAAMNRQHSADDYKRIVERLRAARPDLALSSDFIVGFPGETDADFEDTLGLIREIGYAQAYSFKYSARPGTPAADADTQVPEDVKSARLAELQALLSAQQVDFNNAMVGRVVRLLLEKPGRHPDQLVGRSPWLQAVHVTAAGHGIGDMVDVLIDGVQPNSLAARLVTDLPKDAAA